MARKNKVRLDLEQQLKDKGLYTPAYISLLDDYMFYDAMEKKYQADVEENGSIIQAVSATGKTGPMSPERRSRRAELNRLLASMTAFTKYSNLLQ